MALTSSHPVNLSSEDSSFEALESQLHALQNRKNLLTGSEEKEILRLEGILHTKQYYNQLANSDQSNEFQVKKYLSLKNLISVKQR